MSKINDLNQKLEFLNSQKPKFESLENISLLQFIKYKNIVTKENKIRKQISKYISLKSEINFWYDSINKSWIENPKINCNKYCELERKASYKKNSQLYKLGFISEKPLPLFIENISKLLTPISQTLKSIISRLNFKLQRFNFIKKISKKYNYFKSNILPQQINNLAVNTAKIGIKGYRNLQSNYRLVKNSIQSKNSFKYIRNVINEANTQVLNSEKRKDFRESLRINPNVYYSSLNDLQKRSKTISKKDCSNKDDIEYSL